jgi:methylated-DNA-[protein]-cysteine S-methyltransferase
MRYYYKSELGILELKARDEAIVYLGFTELNEPPDQDEPCGVLKDCAAQLDAYFAKTLKHFDVPIILEGTYFQRRCWAALSAIPYGETRSYKDIAEATGNIKAVRAVGGANHNNPVSIIIPCHRVIGADGGMTGYGGGLWRKEWLLDHERTHTYR